MSAILRLAVAAIAAVSLRDSVRKIVHTFFVWKKKLKRK